MKIDRKRIHFVGIGGEGMCGIAEVLSTMGHIISGSDLIENSSIKRLRGLGVNVSIGHNSTHVEGTDFLIYSSAIKKTNSELIRARELQIPILGRGEMLAELMVFKKGIAVAGTHGKTTTTSIMASIFNETTLDPTVVIGGKFSNIDSNARLGMGDFLIAEVDESDRSFLKTVPTVATITNIDPDHINMFTDHNTSYRDFDDMITAFESFIKKIPLLGRIVINRDDPVLFKITRKYVRDYIFFSIVDPTANFFASDIKFKELNSFFDIQYNGQKIDNFRFPMPGLHNVTNALAAVSTAHCLGVSFECIKRGLENFAGVERRLEFLMNEENRKIVIDYAHHPEEIRCTLKTLREAFPDLKMTVLFQPHRFTRTQFLFDEFTASFTDADRLFITDIYRASEKEIAGISGKYLASKTPGAIYLKDPEKILPELKSTLESSPGLIVFLGAGDIYRLARSLVVATGTKSFVADSMTRNTLYTE